MSHFLVSIIAMAGVLGVMILIHEWGHYAAAKFFKVRVEVFSIGFGKRLFGFRRGETDYRISVLPLGGYVKMSGENPMDDRSDDPGEFLNHPRWQRFIIAVAGPFMNIALAVGLLMVVYMVHYEYPAFLDEPAVVGWIAEDTPAAKAGIQAGDRIVSVNGVQNPTWEQVDPIEYLNPGQPVQFAFQRGNQTFEKSITPEAFGPNEAGMIGWAPQQPTLPVTELEAGMPAEKAGVKVGDQIIALDGKPVPALEAMVDELRHTKDKPVTLTVMRDGKKLDFSLQPVLADVLNGKEKRYRIGISSIPMKVTTLPMGQAFQRSIEQNKKASLLILELVRKMVQGKISPRSVDGPIRIGQAAGQAASEKGWMPLLELTAAISLNLGIFNLLPIPILDGGVITLLLIEGVMRRDISLRIKERIYQAAFVFLVLFAAMVIYNDLLKTLPGLAQRLP